MSTNHLFAGKTPVPAPEGKIFVKDDEAWKYYRLWIKSGYRLIAECNQIVIKPTVDVTQEGDFQEVFNKGKRGYYIDVKYYLVSEAEWLQGDQRN